MHEGGPAGLGELAGLARLSGLAAGAAGGALAGAEAVEGSVGVLGSGDGGLAVERDIPEGVLAPVIRLSSASPERTLRLCRGEGYDCWSPRAPAGFAEHSTRGRREENPGAAVPTPELQHTRPEAPAGRACRSLPSNAALTGALTRLSPTTSTPPDRRCLTCCYAPALD